MKKVSLSMESFVTLLLLHLAKNTKIIDFNNPDNRYACIPFAYKEIIQNILCAENRWKEMFSCLINIEEYFDVHFLWESKMSNMMDNILKKMGKTVVCDFERDKFLVPFDIVEINLLSKNYNNKIINDRMDHFTNLLNAYIYTREFKENHYDYSARSVVRMKKLNEEHIEKF